MFALAALVLSADITPIPKEYKLLSNSVYEVADLQWSCTSQGKDCMPLVEAMKEFYYKPMFPKGAPKPKNAQSAVSKLSITLNTVETPKSPVVGNETYSIVSDQSGIRIEAYDTYALSRALATLCQMITEAEADRYVPGLYVIENIQINDAPVFPFRSVMIDTSRHFLSKEAILRQINAVAVTKLNVLHIHLIDDQSNPFQPVTAPADKYGNSAYNVGGKYQYFMDTMKEIGQHAHNLGVHIVIEYDMPGHARSWQPADNNIVASCGGVVNPLNEETYDYIRGYVQDLVNSVYKPFNKEIVIHLGGDEVNHGCWQNDPNISAYMKENNIDTRVLWQRFHKRVADMITNISAGATRIYWEESIENDNEFNEHAIAHIWYSNQVNKATNKKAYAIRSQGWYLDIQRPGDSHYYYQDSWRDFYKYGDPYWTVQEEDKRYVLGGGACQWGEKIHNGNLDEHIWPRTIAVAEVLWSYPGDRTITRELVDRLSWFVCKVADVGVQTGPMSPMRPCPGTEGIKLN